MPETLTPPTPTPPEPRANTSKPEKLGMEKLAVAFALVLFLVQLGLGMFGVQSFALGILFELGIILLLVYALWVWEGTHGIRVSRKILSSIVITIAIVGAFWSPAKKQYRKEHPQSVLGMKARMIGPYGPDTSVTELYVDIENPDEEAIQNVDLIVSRASKLNITGISEVPFGRNDCKFEPVNLFPEIGITLRGADGKGHLNITTRDVSDEHIEHFGSRQWKLVCERFSGLTSMRFLVGAARDAETDSLQISGTYERIPSEGSAVVKINKTIRVSK